MGITRKSAGGTEKLKQMVERGRSPSAYLQMTAYKKYQEFQAKRWISQNQGEWAPLNPKYSDYKKTRFSAYPGSGTKMMIATGRLVSAVIGHNKDIQYLGDPEGERFHRKLVTDKALKISIDTSDKLVYGQYTDIARTFTRFPNEFFKDIREGLRTYLTEGVK